MGARTRLVAAGLLTMVALGTVGAPVAEGASTGCWVRNVTQGTAGSSFRQMVEAAVDGDRLTVRGHCFARRVIIRADITIRGAGARRAVLNARTPDLCGDCYYPGPYKGGSRTLGVPRGVSVVLRHLVITGGGSYREGGGILNEGTLTLADSVVRGNQALRGGGILNRGTLTLAGSVVSGNDASNGDPHVGGIGGGILNLRGTVTLVRSVVRGNSSPDFSGSAGGIGNLRGRLTLVDSVVRDNGADDWAGGIDNQGRVTLTRSVVRDNGADYGGGIFNSGTMTLTRSSVQGNTAGREGGGIRNQGSLALLGETLVSGNTAREAGGGIWNDDDPDDGVATVTISADSSVIGNTPDDCSGTTAC